MSRRFGPIRQLGYIVRDFDATLQYWIDALGVGPFFVIREVRPDVFRYRGEDSDPPLLSAANAQSGDLQIEIIVQHDDAPSMYRDFRARGGDGLQHYSAWVTNAEYDAILARETAAGTVVLSEAHIGGAVRGAYYAPTGAADEIAYEVSTLGEPELQPLHRMMIDAARDWDGTDPIRELAF
jgi:Glyoxalase/Bleomycin resistance protein/Dioxygenase superfamily